MHLGLLDRRDAVDARGQHHVAERPFPWHAQQQRVPRVSCDDGRTTLLLSVYVRYPVLLVFSGAALDWDPDRRVEFVSMMLLLM
jgi:hypothetical protein